MRRRPRNHERERPSLRALSLVSVVVVAFLALTTIAGLVGGSSLLLRSLDRVEIASEGVARANTLDRSLRDYQRLANLWWAEDGDPVIAQTRATFESEIHDLIDEAAVVATTVHQAQLVGTFDADVQNYFVQRRRIEARELPLNEVISRIQPALERALVSVDVLRAHYENELQRAHATADAFGRVMLLVAGLTGVLLLGTLFAVVLGVRAMVLHPLSSMRNTMERFVTGETEARAREDDGTREICDVARTFNGMADTIEQRRQDMLGFLGGIAHDLRNPISALKLSWQALVPRVAPTDGADLERLDRQLDRLTRMVGDLLDAVRIEAGELELELEDLDLRTSAREMVALYGPTSPAHDVTLDLPEQPVEIRADALRIEQVLSNLLSNAIKYSPEGGKVIVGVAFADGDAELSVTDEGVGIAEESLPYLFAPFRRGTETKDISAGAGLGLSVVHRIVAAHCGHIEVQSAPGRGSTFRVFIPLAPRTPEA